MEHYEGTAKKKYILAMQQRLLLLIMLLLVMVIACSDGDSHFKGTEIYYLAGGGPDHFFSQILAKGARDAASDLGVNLTVLWSDWDRERILLDFKSAVLAQPDGIAVIGYPGDEALLPIVEEARRKGIVVTSHNVDLPEIEAVWQSEGFGYVGQDVRGAGRRLASEAVRKYNVDQHTNIAVIGVPGIPGRGDRTLGILDTLNSLGLEYTLYDVSEEIPFPELIENRLRNILKEYESWDVVFIDAAPIEFTKAMEELDISPKAFAAAAFDISLPNLKQLEEGRLDLLLDQQPYLQGYLPVLQCALSIHYGISGLHILTDGSIIDRSSLELVKPLVEEGIR